MIDNYENEITLMSKLTRIYEYIDNSIPSDRILKIKELLEYFNNKTEVHRSEYKTILVLSKSFRDNILIKDLRNEVLGKYLDLND